MCVYYGSDFHTEFMNFMKTPRVSDYITAVPDDADVVIFAGDCTNGAAEPENDPFYFYLDELCTTRPKLTVIYLPGNHEYYHTNFKYQDSDIWDRFEFKHEKFKYLQRRAFTLNRVLFVGATLWTNFNNDNFSTKSMIEKYLNDYNQITNGDGGLLTPVDVLERNEEDIAYIKMVLQGNIEHNATVVVTHHAPHELSIQSKYRDGSIPFDVNYAYFSDYSALIEQYMPDFWVHGHTHGTFGYGYAGTNVLCNARGYFNEEIFWKWRHFDV